MINDFESMIYDLFAMHLSEQETYIKATYPIFYKDSAGNAKRRSKKGSAPSSDTFAVVSSGRTASCFSGGKCASTFLFGTTDR